MAQVEVIDAALLVFRVWVGAVMLAHGCNHLFGGGRIAGTARWFESMGMRPAVFCAWAATLTEIGCGLMLIAGVGTALACAGVLGTMVVALVTTHLRNGFFIFRPGEGYEYVVTLIAAAVVVAGVGPGALSIDAALLDLSVPDWTEFLAVIALGLIGGLGLLGLAWRPNRPAAVEVE